MGWWRGGLGAVASWEAAAMLSGQAFWRCSRSVVSQPSHGGYPRTGKQRADRPARFSATRSRRSFYDALKPGVIRRSRFCQQRLAVGVKLVLHAEDPPDQRGQSGCRAVGFLRLLEQLQA